MIVKDKSGKSGLWGMEYQGDNLIMTHAEQVDPMMQRAKLIRDHSDNGWSDDKSFRQIGCIPSSVLLKHPEFMQEPKLLKKWLMSEEGAPYRTVSRMRTR